MMYKIDTQSERETQINESLMYRDRKTTRWRGLDTNNNNKNNCASTKLSLRKNLRSRSRPGRCDEFNMRRNVLDDVFLERVPIP